MNQWFIQSVAQNGHNHYRAHLPKKKYNYRSNYLPVLGPDQNTPVVLYTVISVFTLEKEGQVKSHYYLWPGTFYMMSGNFSCKCWTLCETWKL